jgi:hypothetical protein
VIAGLVERPLFRALSAGKRNLDTGTATNQPAGQITQKSVQPLLQKYSA